MRSLSRARHISRPTSNPSIGEGTDGKDTQAEAATADLDLCVIDPFERTTEYIYNEIFAGGTNVEAQDAIMIYAWRA